MNDYLLSLDSSVVDVDVCSGKPTIYMGSNCEIHMSKVLKNYLDMLKKRGIKSGHPIRNKGINGMLMR